MCLRELDNTLKYAGFEWEPHKAGRVFSASLWDLQEELGAEITDSLVIRAMKLEPTTFETFITTLATVDDDNADLSDGIPHISNICRSFYDHHGVFSPVCLGFTDNPVAWFSYPYDFERFFGKKNYFSWAQ